MAKEVGSKGCRVGPGATQPLEAKGSLSSYVTPLRDPILGVVEKAMPGVQRLGALKPR